MSPAVEPQLDRLVSSLIAHRVQFGGFAVVAHRFVRATNHSDLLVPDDIENDRRSLAALSALNAVRDSGRNTDMGSGAHIVAVITSTQQYADQLTNGPGPSGRRQAAVLTSVASGLDRSRPV